ncbi:asparagine synthase (glutamine-hydrolyzing) [Sulfoacidibacillus thermotolerans]|uniref:asparagine synthase (glutamine-hydrolyzing) n=1 Tax=Sulfoacidibacillus thermotolerans TaxID=1765684 RepID=A0A2U3D9T2_SULT2|nr:asparagine synthase (glutamine-hydrolyzing) [Sulfoacidibacillus thermotolerans]PWI58031.1 asparagine synthase (glutamine-hydrolyzing) [Sulfoacidibacillus thermotolerans]
MCGIAILVSKSNSLSTNDALLTHMLDTMQHRGPDDRGTLIQAGIQMGMVRLSIVDISSGAQPIYNEDNSLAIVCNGEIYNANYLRNHLLEKGHIFKTQSDVEVILHLYEDMGEQCVSQIEGIFAFAIWNRHKNKLFLAHDRVGVKPLYYSDLGTHFAFASELRALSWISEIDTNIHPTAFSDYHTFRYIPGEKTIFTGIQRLLPGHFAEVTRGTIHIHRYWSPHPHSIHLKNDRNPAYELQKLMDASVKRQLSTEVDSAVLLSGGLDSTGLLALRNRYVKTDQAITIAFEAPSDETPQVEYSELTHAKQVADHFHIEHAVQVVSADEALEALPQIIADLDEPIADPTSIPLWFASRFAHSKNIKVVYSGEGLDELFAGYEVYGHTRWLNQLVKLPISWRLFLRDQIARHHLRGAGLLQRSLSPIEDWYQGVGGLFTPSELPTILRVPPDHHAISALKPQNCI